MIALCIAILFALASGQSLSICDRYSISSDKADQTKWLQDIVVAVFTQITTGPSNPDLRYFNGAFPHFLPVSTNFTSPASATKLGNLVNGLITFFGGALGCSTITPVTVSIKDIHKNMYVNAEAQQFFIDTLLTVLGSPAGRNVNNVDLATIKSVLDSLTPQIVVPTACSQFNTYNKGFTSESDMMLKIVTNFAGLVTQTGTFTKRYFDGRQPAGSTPLANGGQPLATHLDHVYKYFGGPGWASCLGSDFPDYTFELDNKKIHANMGVTNTTFNQWVKLHVQAISSTTGLTTPNLAGYQDVLNSFRDVVVTSPDSICDKYAWALQVSTQGLVNTVVSGTIQAVLTNPITRPYFNGQQPVGSTDFTSQANGQKATALQNGLIAFFGAALGCKDDTIPAYTGPSMKIVHAAMGVTDQVFDEFNKLLVGVLAKAGVSTTDQATVASVLESLRPDIVQGSVAREAAICPKYSSALNINNQQLVTTVVEKTVAAVAANPLTAPFFNGVKPPGSTNFLDSGNANLLKTLDNSLVAFFGGVLGCSDGTISAYTGADLKTVHSKMGITPSAFDAFNYELLNVMSTLGVSSGDVAAVGVLLESTRSDVQAKYNSETFQPYYLSAGAIVGIIFGALILAALFGGLCVLLTMNEKSLPKLH